MIKSNSISILDRNQFDDDRHGQNVRGADQSLTSNSSVSLLVPTDTGNKLSTYSCSVK